MPVVDNIIGLVMGLVVLELKGRKGRMDAGCG